jgi:hypothetical protein
MVWVLCNHFSTLISLIRVSRLSKVDNDLSSVMVEGAIFAGSPSEDGQLWLRWKSAFSSLSKLTKSSGGFRKG